MGDCQSKFSKKRKMKFSLALASVAMANPMLGPPAGIGKCFIKSILECLPIQESPVCDENSPNFNGVGCAIKLNICLANSMSSIMDCVDSNETKSDACVVKCMATFGDNMNQCSQLSDWDEFKCVTGSMKDAFGCIALCA